MSSQGWIVTTIHDEPTRVARRAEIAREGAMPPMPPSAYDLSGEDALWVERRQQPHPGGVYDVALQFNEARAARMPRTFVDFTSPALATIAKSRQRAHADPI